MTKIFTAAILGAVLVAGVSGIPSIREYRKALRDASRQPHDSSSSGNFTTYVNGTVLDALNSNPNLTNVTSLLTSNVDFATTLSTLTNFTVRKNKKIKKCFNASKCVSNSETRLALCPRRQRLRFPPAFVCAILNEKFKRSGSPPQLSHCCK